MAIREFARLSSSDAAALSRAQPLLIGLGRDYRLAELCEAEIICARICRHRRIMHAHSRLGGEKGEARTAAAAIGRLCPEYYLLEGNGFP
jgi:hypothetical protein